MKSLKNQNNMQCDFYCTCERYDLRKITKKFPKAPIFKDGLILELLDVKAFVFSYGVLVFWNVPKNKQDKIIKRLSQFTVSPLSTVVHDSCFYGQKKKFHIAEDKAKIYLDDKTRDTKLACSYAMSHAVKLEFYEAELEKIIKDINKITADLQKLGKIHLTQRQLSTKIGALFALISSLNLDSEIPDTPDYFWDKPTANVKFNQVRDFMDIDKRISLVNSRLDVVQNLYSLMSEELKHIQSTRLEWIIIALIVIEVVLGLPHHIF